MKHFKQLFVLALLAFLGFGQMWATDPTVIYSESFGSTTSNTALASYSGYSATTSMFSTTGTVASHYGGSGSVGKNNLKGVNLSSGYTGASGNSGCYHSGSANTEATIIQISNIKISGYSDLHLSFGALGNSTSHKVNVSYIIDNGAETSLINNGSLTNSSWTLKEADIPGTGSSLTIYIKHKPTNAWIIRLDDITLTGVASSSPKTTHLHVPNGSAGTTALGEDYVYGTNTLPGQNSNVMPEISGWSFTGNWRSGELTSGNSSTAYATGKKFSGSDNYGAIDDLYAIYVSNSNGNLYSTKPTATYALSLDPASGSQYISTNVDNVSAIPLGTTVVLTGNGGTVTIWLVARDDNSEYIDDTDSEANTFTFAMPASDVTALAEFYCANLTNASVSINTIAPEYVPVGKTWRANVSWDAVDGATAYEYKLVRTTDSYEAASGTTSETSVLVEGLSSSAVYNYKFSIKAKNNCPSNNIMTNYSESPIFATTPMYALSYAANGGSEVPATAYYKAGVSVTTAAATEKVGNDFDGWLRNDNSTKIEANTAFNMPAADLTLTAQWQIKSFTVTFDKNANDATGEMAVMTREYNTVEALTTNTFERSGYQFMGWATTSDGAVVYTNGANYTFTANADLYAVWAELHTVTYTAATGTAPAAVEVAEGTQTTLPNALTGMPDGCNWSLVGWYCGNDDLALTNTTAPPSDYGAKNTNVTINGDVTYKAVYKKTVNTQTPTTITGATKSITSDTNADGWNTNSSYKSFTTSVQEPIVIDIPSTATITNVALSVSQAWSAKDNNGVTVTIGTTDIGTLVAGKYSIDIPGEKQSKGAKLTLTHTTAARHANHNGITITYSYDGEEETETHYYSTSTDCCTAYNVNIDDGITGGTVEADKAKECAGETVTLTITPDDGKELDVLTVDDVDVTDYVENGEYSFTMPAAAVDVNATFKNQAAPFISLTETALDFEQVEKNTTSSGLTFKLNANEGCTANVTYALTGDDDEVFSVSPTSPITLANAQAQDGQTITVTFSPKAAKSYSATLTFSTTGAESKSIALSGTGINLYTVTFDKGTGDCETASAKQASLGASVNLPEATASTLCDAENWVFAGWSETAVADETETEPTLLSGETYTPSENKTLYAVYTRTDGDYASDEIDADFTGVTGSSYTPWSKKGSASDAVYAGTSARSNYGSVQIKSKDSNTGIVMTASGGNVSKVTVVWDGSNGDKLDIYGKNTAYSAVTDLFGTETQQGTKLGSIVKGTSTVLEINGNYAFIGMRSYDGAIYLDKITVEMGSSTTVYHSTPSCTGKATLTYNANEATTGSAPDAVEYDINEEVTVAAMPEGLAKTGHEFAGWNTKADGTGTTYAAGTGSFTIKKNTILYAKWTKKSYTVTVTDPGNGNSITAPVNNASVEYGAEVTLTSSATTHWTFSAWSVTETDSENPVTVTNGKFTMPAAAVTVSATFNEDAKRNVLFYSNGEQIGETQAVYVGEKPVAETATYDACLEGSNIFYGWATEEWTGAIDATALEGKTYYASSAIPNVASGTGDIEYFAIWGKKNKANTFNLLSDANDFVSGADYIIASYDGEDDWKLKAENYNSNTNQQVATQTSIGSNYEETDGKYIWTITTENGNAVSIYNEETKKYLAISSSNLVLQDAKATFTKSVTDGGSNSDHFEFAVSTSYLNFYDDSHPYYNAYTKKDGALYLYLRDVTYSDFRTNCCSLKPVTGLTVSEVAETSVTLSWTAPKSKTGINKYQIVDAEHSIAQNVTDVDATSAVVTGLTECTTYHFYVASVGAECSSKSASVPATPYSGALTVTFDYNGGEGSVTSASTSCGVATVNLPTPDDRDGYHFKGWNDGTQTLAPSTETYTPAATMTLTAQWAQLYTLHYDFDGVSGAPADAQYEAGEQIELPSNPYKSLLAPFEAWDYSAEVTMVDETHFTMPASNLTITATYDEKVGQWIKVTNTNTLSAGDYVVIASEDWDYALSTTQNENNRAETQDGDITKSGSTITINNEDRVQVFVLEAGTVSGSWKFKCLNGAQKNKYIYAASSSNNQLKSSATPDNAKASWVLDVENGKATAQGESTHNILSYNVSGSDNIFSAYTSIKGEIAFYQFREGTFYNVNMPSPAVTGGVLETNTTMQKAGETVTLTYYPTKGYTVGTLTVTDADEAPVAVSPAVEAGVTEYTFTMPAKEVTVAASFTALPPVVYNLVEDAADLIPGMQFLMVAANSNNYFANSGWSSDHFNAVSINTPSQKKVSITSEEVKNIILDGESGAWKFMQDGVQRLGTWAISIENGVATIENGDVVKFNHNNGNNPRFKNYDANWTGPKPALYALPTETYNLQFQEENDTPIKTITIAEGYTYKYTIKSTDRPTIPETYEFLAWTDGTNKYKTGDVVTVSAGTILRPCWKVTPTANVDINTLPTSVTEIVVEDGKTLTIGADRNLDNLIVEAGGKVSIAENKTLTVNTFTIESTMASGKSGQLNGATAVNFEASEAYIDIKLGAGGTNQQWHAFTVPFPVDVMNGIYDLNNEKLDNEVNYAIMEYHGDERAKGNYGWKKIRTTLVPGTFYIMATDGYRTTYRFKKKAGAALVAANSKSLSEYPIDGGEEDKDNGWNGVGNPTLMYGKVDYNVYVLDPDIYDYVAKPAKTVNFVVGTPFFIQADANGSVSMLTADAGANYAPARVKATEITNVDVTFGNDVYTDHLYISASEDALNEYQIGKDLVKMTMSNTPRVGRIFSNAYGHQLTMVYAPLSNDQAIYDLSLYAPQAGTYSIAVPNDVDATIYLTYEGSIIWDLTASAYEIDLTKGTTEGYGLILRTNAPAVVTGVDQIDAKAGAQKVIIDEHVYILRGGQMYDVNGKMVK